MKNMQKYMQKFTNAFIFTTLVLAEFVGSQIAIFFPDASIPLLLFLEWILFQVAVSLMLVIYIGKFIFLKEKETARLINMAVFCLLFQAWGLFHSRQIFAAASALSDSMLIYLFSR